MKQITVAGNIGGKDAQTRTTQGGDSVTRWSVAVEERNGRDKRTLWFDVSLWGKRGQALAQYLTRGSKVAVSGELSTREHEGRTYLTIRADQVTLLGGGKPADSRHDDQPRGNGYGQPDAPEIDDEIPF